METSLMPICYCHVCTNSKSKIIILRSNPMKEIENHIELHRKTFKNNTKFTVNMETKQNRKIYTIVKEIEPNISASTDNNRLIKTEPEESAQIQSAIVIKEEVEEGTSQQDNDFVEVSSPPIPEIDTISKHICSILLNKIDRDGCANCFVCNKKIHAACGSGIDVFNVVEHSKTHLETKLYSCNRCSFGAKSESSMKLHLFCQHKLERGTEGTEYEDLSADHEEKIIDVITRCFDQNRVEPEEMAIAMEEKRSVVQMKFAAPTTNSVNSVQTRYKFEFGTNSVKTSSRTRMSIDRQKKIIYGQAATELLADRRSETYKEKRRLASIRNSHCRRFIDEFDEFAKSNKILCRICKKNVNLENIDQNTKQVIQHVLTHHLKKPIYVCRLCGKSFKNYGCLNNHFLNQHKAKRTGKYDDHMDEYHEEIMAGVTECFDWSKKSE